MHVRAERWASHAAACIRVHLSRIPPNIRSASVGALRSSMHTYRGYGRYLHGSVVTVSIHGGKGGPGGPGAVGGPGGIGEGPRVTVFRPQISNMTVHSDVTNHSPSDTRKKLDKWLSPVKVATSQQDAANKRHPKTGLWLLERTEFIQWIYARNSFLWLEGISGSGKTVLSSTIIDTLRARAEPLAFFYFDTNNSEQRKVTQLLCSLVSQLSARGPSPDTILDTLWSSYSGGQLLPPDSVLISEALIPILKEFTEPVYIVLDALDECSQWDHLLTMITTILDVNLPNVHLLLTSRPEVPRSSTKLAKCAVLVSLQDRNHQDIESYLTKQLSDFDYGWSAERQAAIRKSLLKRGSGMFRLVSLQLDELRNCDGSDHQINEALATMPSSLDEIYDRIIRNIKKPAMVSAVLRAMNWLIFYRRLLTVEEIIDALAFDFEEEPLRFSTDRRMQSKPFLESCAGIDHVLENDTDLRRYPLAPYYAENWAFYVKHCDEICLAQCGITPVRCKPPTLDPFSLTYWFLLAVFPPLAYLLCLFVEGVKQARSAEAHSSAVPITAALSRNTPRLVDTVLELLQADRTPYLNLSRLHYPEASWLKSARQWEQVPILPALHLSSYVGIGPVVWELLEYGAEVNAQGGEYGNALQAASLGGVSEIVRLLLDHSAEINAQGGEYGNALQAASWRGASEIVRLLLDHGAKINAQGGEYGNALQAASWTGASEIVRLLLDHGAEINAQGGKYGNALQAASWRGHIETVHLLLEHGAEVNAQGGLFGNALLAACSNSHTEIVRLLLEYGANMNMVCPGHVTNALGTASVLGYTQIVRLLLRRGAEVNAPDRLNGTALQAASMTGHTEIVRLLLEHGAEINAQGGEYGNALQASSWGGASEIVRLLLDHGAEINAQGGRYGNALQAACEENHVEIVHLLLEHGAKVNSQDGGHSNALQVAFSESRTEIVRLLLEHGANVNAVYSGHLTNALQIVSSIGHAEIVHLLLSHGAKVNTPCIQPFGGALQRACSKGHIDVVHLLLEHSAEVNAEGYHARALLVASSKGYIGIVRLLLECGAEINAQNECHSNALQAASSEGCIEIVRLLLEHGAEVDAVGLDKRLREKSNALEAACRRGHSEIVHLLLEHGAKLNVQSGYYGNAMQTASSHGHIEIARMLLEHGADVDAEGGRYGNALHVACLGGHIGIVRLLLEHGAEAAAPHRIPRRTAVGTSVHPRAHKDFLTLLPASRGGTLQNGSKNEDLSEANADVLDKDEPIVDSASTGFDDLQPTRVFVNNVPYNLDEAGLAKEFGKHHIRVKRATIYRRQKRHRGIGCVVVHPDDYGRASMLDDQIQVHGRRIGVKPFRPKNLRGGQKMHDGGDAFFSVTMMLLEWHVMQLFRTLRNQGAV
ncbi:ankyrin repeat-containing domain protein [Mycena leptocephala]|nr:ankyrin repeat-containing domain protein [Mycena leptocephala]